MLLQAAVLALSGCVVVSLVTSASQVGPAPTAEAILTQAVSLALSGLGTLIGLWYGLTAALMLVADLLSAIGSRPVWVLRWVQRFGAPLLRQLAVLTAASCVVAAPAWSATGPVSAAHASISIAHSASAGDALLEGSEPATSRNSSALVDLGWATSAPPPESPEPERPEPEIAAPTAEGDAPSIPRDPTEAATYVVQPGDSLWTIAADHLRDSASPATPAHVAAHWPQWYSGNIGVIGPDPDLIHPGMILHAPTKETP